MEGRIKIIPFDTPAHKAQAFLTVMSMYLGEICPVCKAALTELEDLKDARFCVSASGRVVHGVCWDAASDNALAELLANHAILVSR